jgi:ribose 5-phosphate isomerase
VVGEPATRRRLLDLVPEATLRHTPDGSPFVTDEGRHPLDCTLPPGDLEPVATALKAALGVVDHGLFLTHADEVLLGDPGRVGEGPPPLGSKGRLSGNDRANPLAA